MDYFYLVTAWIFFYGMHSLLASGKIKRIFQEKWGLGAKRYRLFYSIFSGGLLVGLMGFAVGISPRMLGDRMPLVVYAGYMLATFGTIILVQSTKSWSIRRFLGILPEKGEPDLIHTGWYGRVRHPLYLGLLLIFFGYFLVSATLAALIHLLCLLLYLPMGIYWEEKKLEKLFGAAYNQYQQETPVLFPRVFRS